jgi:hypothetical protein
MIQPFHHNGVKKENFSGAYDAWLAGLHPEDRVQAEKDFQMALSGEKEFDTEFALFGLIKRFIP